MQNETAIPCGRFRVVVTHSAHFNKDLPELLGVPGYVGVRIHAGNKASDTEGCLVTGTSVASGGEAVAQSRLAFDKLFTAIVVAITAGEEVWITIK